VTTALRRFQFSAYVVGIGLLILVFVAMPLKYFADEPLVVQVVSPIHGLLFILYLLSTLELSARSRWPVRRTALIMLAGTIPFLSFIVERRVVRDSLTAEPPGIRNETQK
jgi:integral membrane protein